MSQNIELAKAYVAEARADLEHGRHSAAMHRLKTARTLVEIEVVTDTVEWAKRNPAQCNLWYHEERLANLQREVNHPNHIHSSG